jgi:hypothetical protein
MCAHIDKRIYYKELAHTITEAGKVQDEGTGQPVI